MRDTRQTDKQTETDKKRDRDRETGKVILLLSRRPITTGVNITAIYILSHRLTVGFKPCLLIIMQSFKNKDLWASVC